MDNSYRQQTQLLLNILGHMDWNSCMALKGGTAINLFIADFPRLSVDIDLAYIGHGSREWALSEMSHYLNELLKKLEKRGYLVNLTGVSSENLVGKLNVSINNIIVIIEPNFIIRGAFKTPVTKKLVQSAANEFKQELEIKILHEDELYAGKLVAMLARKHPRDVFDMKIYIEKNKSLKAIMDLFIAYLIQSPKPFSELLNPHFDKEQFKYDFNNSFAGMVADSTITDEILHQTWLNLVALVKSELNVNHKNFLLSLMKLEPNWSLSPFDQLEKYPGVLWKIQNIKRMTEPKRSKEIEAIEQLFVRKST